MTIEDIKQFKENYRLEAKAASEKLPNSIWETYSAFANTSGGLIALGISEPTDGVFVINGLSNAEKLKNDFWNLVNDSHKVSKNILLEENVYIEKLDGKEVLFIYVPRAEWGQKPIYINNNLWNGTYKRNHKGDYHCTELEIRAMVAESQPIALDEAVFEEDVSLADLSMDSVHAFRNRFATLRPTHSWNELDDEQFLLRVGALRMKDGEKRITRAGLLFFGEDWTILKKYPDYLLDYQYWDPAGNNERWSHRIQTGLGEGIGNIFDFFLRVSQDLALHLPNKFQIKAGSMERDDDSEAKKATREILINALANADYAIPRGVVIVYDGENINASNPGRMMVEPEKALLGGTSEPRNKIIFRLFNFIGFGDRSGWGISYLNSFATKYSGVPIQIEEEVQPDRTTIIVPFYEKCINVIISLEEFLASKQRGETFTRQEASLATGLSESGLSKQLNASLARGVIHKGAKRGIYIKG